MIGKKLRRTALMISVLAAGPILMAASGSLNLGGDWRTASRHSAEIAPLPEEAPEAIVQVYAGRAFRWRGIFGVHTWIATKRAGARTYVVHDVIGWRGRGGASTVASYASDPDRYWFGARPELLAEIRGDVAEEAINRIFEAVRTYPHANEYVLWPGPNSNTFVAHVARAVPELRLDLPPTAIGKDYIPHAGLFAGTPSGTGAQFSLVGALGLMVSAEEGVELNVLGLTLGVDPLDLAIKLPGVGRLELPVASPTPDF